MIAAKQTLGTAAMVGSVLQRPSTSRQELAGHILGTRPVMRPSIQVPASITQSSPVQTLKQDIAKFNEPVTDKTLVDVVADRQIKKAKNKATKQQSYMSAKQIGKNTGEQLRKEVGNSPLRRFFSSSKQKKE